MAATDWDAATFETYRPLLFSIAYRMLGSASEAEDVVQDTWLRARQDAQADVRSPRAYLTTIVTRLCIDHLRSAERTRMEYPGPWLPEPLAEPNQESTELASSLTTAFLVLLEQLAPTERAVFLLREVFELDFDEIAKSVGKSEANTRQILTRARGRLHDSKPRFTPVTEACRKRRTISSDSRRDARPACSCAMLSRETVPTRSTSSTAVFARYTSCATPTNCAGSSSERTRHGADGRAASAAHLAGRPMSPI
jgi:RNA polymerase sigma factor (sigma-70 family)